MFKSSNMQNENTVKDSILMAAREIFSKFGFRKTTLDDIARLIGRGKSALYYYYKSKEEIFEAVLEYEVDLLKIELQEALKGENDPKAKLRKYIIRRMEMFYKLVNVYSAFQQEYLENLAFLEGIRKKYDEQENAMISEILNDGISRGIFVNKDVELTSFAIIMAMRGFEYPFSQESDLKKVEGDIDQLLEVLFYGLIKR